MKPKLLLTCISFLFITQLANAQSSLWALGFGGGVNGDGTILQADSSGNNFHSVYSFVNATGAAPLGNLVMANNDKLYGVTKFGGIGDSCVIFTYDPVTGNYTSIHDFFQFMQYGYGASSGLIEASNGILYGLAGLGGSHGGGVIYNVDPSTNAYGVLYNFSNVTGTAPGGCLLQLANGKLYGMNSIDGLNGGGIIFSFDPSDSSFVNLYNFNDPTGKHPLLGSLIQATNSLLYGMTFNGGANSNGVIFSFDLSNNLYTDLYDFNGTNGAQPWGSLVQASNGLLYGMTYSGGANNQGIIFSYDINTGNFTDLLDFDGTNGAQPFRSLIQASNGKLYGTTSVGGQYNFGVAFSFNITNNVYTKLFDFDGLTNGSYPDCDIFEMNPTPTGIPVIKNDVINIFPNPAVNTITIAAGRQQQVQFFDVMGRNIGAIKTSASGKTVSDISSFPNLFFAKTENGLVKKVVRK